jgi:hypothetical protein
MAMFLSSSVVKLATNVYTALLTKFFCSVVRTSSLRRGA